MMSTATLTREAYAVSYDRVSRFRDANDESRVVTCGPDRQHKDNGDAAADRGLGGIRERFSDKGRSASRFRTREREQWLALLDAIRSGRVTHVLVWVLDRIVRTDEDRVALLAACREGGAVIVQSGTGTVVDPADPDSVFLATVLGAVAELEVAKMSKRIRRFQEEAAEAGRPHGGRRWFGYLDGNMVPDEVEAAIFRDLVGRLLHGEALHSLARSLSEAGVPTVAGGKWSGPNLRHILMSPRYAGRRIHKGEDIGRGAWVPLIDEATYESVARRLGDPARRTNKGSNARKFLLSNLAVCATCGAGLRGKVIFADTKRSEGYGSHAYACSTGRHVHRSMAYVDAVVEALVVERLSRSDMSGALVDDDAADEARALIADRDALRGALDDLADMLAARTIGAHAYATGAARVEANLAELDERVAAASARATAPVAILDGMTGEHARAAWNDADLGRRRALVGLMFERVALRGGRGPFTPECVEVDWR